MNIKRMVSFLVLSSLIPVLCFAGEKGDLVETFRLNKLTEILDLNETQLSKLITAEKNLKKIQNEFNLAESDNIKELEKLIKEKNYDKAEKLVDKIEIMDKEKFDALRKIRRDYMKSLNNEQKSKYILFELQFKNGLKDKIVEKMKHGK